MFRKKVTYSIVLNINTYTADEFTYTLMTKLKENQGTSITYNYPAYRLKINTFHHPF